MITVANPHYTRHSDRNFYLRWQGFLAVMIMSVVESNGATRAKPKTSKCPPTRMNPPNLPVASLSRSGIAIHQ
jgi:hypothetical protein